MKFEEESLRGSSSNVKAVGPRGTIVCVTGDESRSGLDAPRARSRKAWLWLFGAALVAMACLTAVVSDTADDLVLPGVVWSSPDGRGAFDLARAPGGEIVPGPWEFSKRGAISSEWEPPVIFFARPVRHPWLGILPIAPPRVGRQPALYESGVKRTVAGRVWAEYLQLDEFFHRNPEAEWGFRAWTERPASQAPPSVPVAPR